MGRNSAFRNQIIAYIAGFLTALGLVASAAISHRKAEAPTAPLASYAGEAVRAPSGAPVLR